MLFTQGNSYEYFVTALSCRFRMRFCAVDEQHCVCCATNRSCAEQQVQPSVPGEQTGTPALRDLRAATLLKTRAEVPVTAPWGRAPSAA